MFQHLQDVTFAHLLWYFLIYACLGWCLEVVFCSVNTGKFVNRGFLNGPVCPIYGFGGVAMVVLLGPVADDSLLLLYIASAVVCSLLELLAGYLMEKLFHTRWWDYSNEPFNIGGYICLKFGLGWGLAGIVLMRGVHPIIAGLVGLIPNVLGWVLLAVFYSALLADLSVTVVAVRKLDRDLGEMTRLTAEIHKGSEAMAQRIGNTAIALAKKVETLELDEKKQQLDERVAAEKAKLADSINEGRQKLEALSGAGGRVRRRLLRAFPDMKNLKNAEALEEMKKQRNFPNTAAGASSSDETSEN